MHITVDFYEKTESICPSCNRMKIVLKMWKKKHPEHDLEVNYFSAEEHLKDLQSFGVREAPVIFVRRGDAEGSDMVAGKNPDILVDLLDGRPDIWEL